LKQIVSGYSRTQKYIYLNINQLDALNFIMTLFIKMHGQQNIKKKIYIYMFLLLLFTYLFIILRKGSHTLGHCRVSVVAESCEVHW